MKRRFISLFIFVTIITVVFLSPLSALASRRTEYYQHDHNGHNFVEDEYSYTHNVTYTNTTHSLQITFYGYCNDCEVKFPYYNLVIENEPHTRWDTKNSAPEYTYIDNGYHYKTIYADKTCVDCKYHKARTDGDIVSKVKLSHQGPDTGKTLNAGYKRTASGHSKQTYHIHSCSSCKNEYKVLITAAQQSHSFKFESSSISNGIITSKYRCTTCGYINTVQARMR